MAKTWAEIVAEAKQKTDRQLLGDITSLTRLTQEEIDNIAPAKLDKENLANLIHIVKDATKGNEEKAQAIRNTDQYLSLLITIASKLL